MIAQFVVGTTGIDGYMRRIHAIFLPFSGPHCVDAAGTLLL